MNYKNWKKSEPLLDSSIQSRIFFTDMLINIHNLNGRYFAFRSISFKLNLYHDHKKTSKNAKKFVAAKISHNKVSLLYIKVKRISCIILNTFFSYLERLTLFGALGFSLGQDTTPGLELEVFSSAKRDRLSTVSPDDWRVLFKLRLFCSDIIDP